MAAQELTRHVCVIKSVSYTHLDVYKRQEIHRRLDEIEQIHAIYSPARLGLAAAIALSLIHIMVSRPSPISG